MEESRALKEVLIILLILFNKYIILNDVTHQPSITIYSYLE